MKRQTVLVGYRVEKGVIYAQYEKQIVEDDNSIKVDGTHRETITQEAYDTIKRENWIDERLLEHAKEISDITIEKEAIKAEKIALEEVILTHEEDKRNLSALVLEKNSEIEDLKVKEAELAEMKKGNNLI